MCRRASNTVQNMHSRTFIDPHQYDFIKTQHPWGAWANCPLKAFENLFSGSQLQWHLRREEYVTLCSLTGSQCPRNTNTAQEIPGEFIPGSHFASQAGLPHCLGESGFVKLSTFSVYGSLTEVNIYLPLLLQSSTFSIISFNHSTYKLFHFTLF